tara:strand:+ start:320 stop:670 length:351 start_codon:yes stop_codon:yes gene_type:complete
MGVIKGVGAAIRGFGKALSGKNKVAPTITQPRQLKNLMKQGRKEHSKFGFEKAKSAKDRANIVRTKKSIERMDKLQSLKTKRDEGIKARKGMKKMVETNQADKIGGQYFHRHIKTK